LYGTICVRTVYMCMIWWQNTSRCPSWGLTNNCGKGETNPFSLC